MKLKFDNVKEERVDVFLQKHLFDLSRTKIQFLIKNQKIKINNTIIIKPNHKLKNLDEISVDYLEDTFTKEITPWNKKSLLNIIIETKDYIIINKPHNLSVHLSPDNLNKTLVNILVSEKKELSSLNKEESCYRPGIVHRLDKNTTGVLVVSKTISFHNCIKNQFKNHETKKTYYALITGVMNDKKGLIDAPIGRDPKIRKKMKVTSVNSKKALTNFEVIEIFKDFSLIKFEPITGRTHQIRVHANYIGHPICNDSIYGKMENDNHGFFLHARKIEFNDLEGNRVFYEAEFPKYFNEKLKNLIEEK